MRTTAVSRSTSSSGRTGRGVVRTVAVGVAASALGLTCAVSAQAAPGATAAAGQQSVPDFLSGEDLPPHATSPWFAGEITEGLPDPATFCVTGVDLPEENASHRKFTTEVDTGALQLNIVTEDEEVASELAKQMRESVANCAADWLRDNPGGTASWQDLGSQDVGDGAHAYGVHINTDYGAQDVHLFGVGQDGDTVTLVRWGQMGTLENAPIPAFRETVTTAVEKLHS